ncbi:unnamed protein product [Tilletia controversa]|nr:unnamed protein product [Tilletia controversa]
MVEHSPTIYLDELAFLLQHHFNLDVCIQTISNSLHSVGFTNKKLTREAIQRDEGLRREHALTFAQFQPFQLIFADESHADRRTFMRQRGWSRLGSPAVQIGLFLRGERYTLLPGLTHDGIIAPWVVAGSVNGERFLHWVQEYLLPHMNPWPMANSVLVLDNCSTHKGEDVRRVIEAKGCHLLFLPPYSPDLNPIEYAFAAIKRRLKRTGASTEWDVISACYESVTSDHAAAYFQACGYARTRG